MNFIPIQVINPGINVSYYPNSLTKRLKSENGESKINPAIVLSLDACIIAVLAPILLPQRPIVLTLPVLRRYSITTFRSSFSKYPRDMYLPSELPLPAKSKAKTVIFSGSKYLR